MLGNVDTVEETVDDELEAGCTWLCPLAAELTELDPTD